MPKPKVAILIPCFNEAKTIRKVVKDHKKSLPAAKIYVYDNNSTDKTAQIAQKAGATVCKEPRQGKGSVVRSMFRDIDADIYIVVDGDDTYPANIAPKMAELVSNGKADMVVGDRLSSTYFTENKRAFHDFGNRIVRFAINFLFKSKIHDVMTGQRAFSRDFAKSFPVISRGFEIETEMTIHALDKNLKIVEMPVKYKDRPVGSESKLNTVSDGIKVLLTIFNMLREYRPMLFFNIFALLSLVAGSIFTSIPVIEFFEQGTVSRFPTLIVGVLFLIVALLLWVTGLISDLIARKHRQLFEINLNILRKL